MLFFDGCPINVHLQKGRLEMANNKCIESVLFSMTRLKKGDDN